MRQGERWGLHRYSVMPGVIILEVPNKVYVLDDRLCQMFKRQGAYDSGLWGSLEPSTVVERPRNMSGIVC